MDKVKVDRKDIAKAIEQVFPKDMNKDNTIFVCIGTDRSTGDSLAPLVGTRLKRAGYKVYGTLVDPVHAMNLEDTILKLSRDRKQHVVAIDACLGQTESVGKTQVFKGSVRPGAGVGKNHLPPVGDYGITPIVNVGGFMEYFVLQNTRLSLVMNLADAVFKGLNKRFSTKTVQLVAASKE